MFLAPAYRNAREVWHYIILAIKGWIRFVLTCSCCCFSKMSSSNFSGSLATKKKGDLSEICSALGISSTGTRDDLQTRIRDHLDEKPHLADNPTYSGLYPKKRTTTNTRKTSVIPVLQHDAESTEEDSPPQPRKVTRILKGPTSTLPPSPTHVRASPTHAAPSVHATPISAPPVASPPLRASPVRSLFNDVALNAAPDAQAVVEAVVEVEAKFVTEAERFLTKARGVSQFLSFLFWPYSNCYPL